MVESTCFQHTSSHPDKYNDSVDRIISKEEEREDIQREILQSSSNTSGVSTYNPSTEYSGVSTLILQELQCFHTQSSNSKIFLHTELILPQEILQLQGSSRAVQYKASSSDCSRAPKHSTRQNPAIRPLQYKQASGNSTR